MSEYKKSNKKPIGQRLIDQAVITSGQLDLALREQKRLGGYLGESLVRLGFITNEALSKVLASEANVESIDISSISVDSDVLSCIPLEMAQKLFVLPIDKQGDRLTVVMADPFDVLAIDSMEKECGMRVDTASAPEIDVKEAIIRNYMHGISINEIMDTILREGLSVQEDDSDSASMIRLVDQLIAEGARNKATDIHIEPDEKVVRMRMRVDGVLQRAILIPKPLQMAIAARIKIMGGMNITEKRLPQDGRISYPFGKRVIDIRVSSLPNAYGENIVMRLLDQGNVNLNLSGIGLSKHNALRFKKAINKPHGIILVTGPTGSGKTTTLYAALNEVNTEDRSIFTLEDPIEYRLPLVCQTQIHTDHGLTFAAGLRALLRQDPDIILLGEIRDAETAELAVRASLTGHLVFSTLHTNDAVGAIPRLIDMGIEPYLLPACLTSVMGQRLVRRLCETCKKVSDNPRQELHDIGVALKDDSKPKLYHPAGCEDCNETGYKGRVTINEVLLLNEAFHDEIINGANAVQLMRLATENGMRTMFMDGVGKALQGLTSIQEVLRVSSGH